MANVTYVTAEGLKRLKEELDVLQNVERPSISRQIAEARDKGDLSENAEYHAAKEAQGLLELKISKLQDIVVNARLIDESKFDNSSVQLLSKVSIKNKNTNATMVYTIVGQNEANIKEGKISLETPIAKGLLGKKIGDSVAVQVPSGPMEFIILDISR